MPNITISIQDELLHFSREYAKKHNLSLNALIRELLAQRVGLQKSRGLKECFRLMDRARGNSKGRKWERGDLYRV